MTLGISELQTIFNTKVPVHLTLHNCLEPNQSTEASPVLQKTPQPTKDVLGSSRLIIAQICPPKGAHGSSSSVFNRKSRSLQHSCEHLPVIPQPSFWGERNQQDHSDKNTCEAGHLTTSYSKNIYTQHEPAQGLHL